MSRSLRLTLSTARRGRAYAYESAVTKKESRKPPKRASACGRFPALYRVHRPVHRELGSRYTLHVSLLSDRRPDQVFLPFPFLQSTGQFRFQTAVLLAPAVIHLFVNHGFTARTRCRCSRCRGRSCR
jgi:hypothetical protein